MRTNEAFETLDKLWSRDEVLTKIKNGAKPENIANDFFDNNKKHIENLSNLFRPADKEVLLQIEKLSKAETRLLNRINQLSAIKNEFKNIKIEASNEEISNIKLHSKLGSFMIEWSNKFVFIALITISLIALTKQAWA